MKASISVVGVKEALRELNDLDKSARRQLTRDYRELVNPLVVDAKRHVPNEAPLSGMARSWTPRGASAAVLPYTGAARRGPSKPTEADMARSREARRQYSRWAQWDAGIKAYVSGKRPRTVGGTTRNLSAFGVRWQGPAAVLFDTAGQSSTPQGARLVSALTARYGAPSRVMWRAWNSAGPEVQEKVAELIERLMRRVGRKIQAGPR